MTADQAELVAAASAAAGLELTSPVTLAGSGRSVVLRCQAAAGPGGTVIVKSYPLTPAGRSSFAAEAAGLELTADSGLCPHLLASDPAAGLVVMSDLGPAPSLADLLLGGPSAAVAEGVLAWASACGRMVVATSGRRTEFAARRDAYAGGQPDESVLAGTRGRVLDVARQAGRVGVAAPDGLGGELAEVARMLSDGPCPVLSPGDLCPDNNLITADGVRFLDFESTTVYSVFLDAAYVRMPFSTCWCVFRLPADLQAAAEAAYRAEVARLYPELADDDVWQPGVRRGSAVWTLSSMWWLLDRALAADEPMVDARPSPGRRQLMRYRWQRLADDLAAAGELPALAELLRSLLAATRGWQAPELPGYPALSR